MISAVGLYFLIQASYLTNKISQVTESFPHYLGHLTIKEEMFLTGIKKPKIHILPKSNEALWISKLPTDVLLTQMNCWSFWQGDQDDN